MTTIYKFISIHKSFYGAECTVTHDFEGTALDEICQQFEYFLKGSGFSFDDLADYFEAIAPEKKHCENCTCNDEEEEEEKVEEEEEEIECKDPDNPEIVDGCNCKDCVF